MKVNWILRANISDINFNQSYSDYDDRCLESTYWLYDITSFIKDFDGYIISKKSGYINEYDITFEINKYNLNIKEFIKFRSGRFYTYNIKCIEFDWKKII